MEVVVVSAAIFLLNFAVMCAMAALVIAFNAICILAIVVIIYAIYARDKPLKFFFTYIWKLTSKDLADSLNNAAKTTEELTETAKDIQVGQMKGPCPDATGK